MACTQNLKALMNRILISYNGWKFVEILNNSLKSTPFNYVQYSSAWFTKLEFAIIFLTAISDCELISSRDPVASNFGVEHYLILCVVLTAIHPVCLRKVEIHSTI